MTAEQQLERSVLESKERDELHAIAQALSVKTNTRTKKADIIDGILKATGVAVDAAPEAAPARVPRGRSRTSAAPTDGGDAGETVASTNGDHADNGDHAGPDTPPGASGRRTPPVQSFGPADDAAGTDVSAELDYDFDDLPGTAKPGSGQAGDGQEDGSASESCLL